MMKNKISTKLMINFSISLISFSIIIGLVFSYLFSDYTTKIHKNDLQKRAETIAGTLSDYYSDSESLKSSSGKGKGYGSYMKFLDDIAMSDVWLVDKESQLISRGKGNMNLNYSELPKDAEYVIEEAFQGKTSFSESFSDILNTKSITVGTPIKNYDDSVIGVVLLHSPVEDISSSIHGGFKILIVSIALALIIAIIISMFMSLSFTKPLSKMKDTAILLSKGNYKVKTEVHQCDEIGELASSIDILSEKLYEASLESEKLEKLRNDFISNISHELRTPVTVLRGSLEALCDGIITKPDKVSEYHNQMLHESIHLQRLVNDLLDLSKLQNVDFKIEMDNLDLSLITEEVIHSMNRIAAKDNIKIFSNLSLSHCAILGDYSRIRQMLMIVLDNAVKFSKESSLITVNLIKNENYIELSVIDKGCGISKEDLPYIFDRFHKSNSTENKNGTGLGLAIAKQIANRHNIKIDVTSEPYIETCFTFKFPLT